MNIKEAVEYCKTHNARIHTPTRETYDKLMEYLEEQGYRWQGGEKPTEYDGYTPVNSVVIAIDIGGITHSSLWVAKECGREILEITKDTFAEKLEKFIAGDIVFHVDSWELCEELAKVFDAKGINGGNSIRILKNNYDLYGDKEDSYVECYKLGIYHGTFSISPYKQMNRTEKVKLTTVTIKEVQEYLKSTKVIGGFFRPQKVTVRTPEVTLEFQANVTQTTDGLLIEQLVEPKFSVGDKVYTATAKVGTVTDVGKHPSNSSKVAYGITWVNGKSSTHILEEHLTKLEELL